MKIAIGCDHGALEHKNAIAAHLTERGFEVEDFGNGTVIVRSCPMDLDSCEIIPLITEIAEYLRKMCEPYGTHLELGDDGIITCKW